jgi:hypothetical protein
MDKQKTAQSSASVRIWSHILLHLFVDTYHINPVTCVDPRCTAENFFGPGFRGPVVQNAGGRATDDAVRSLTILRAMLNLKVVVVVHHTGRIPFP